MADAGVGDHGELDAETGHYAHDENADKELKDAQAFHLAIRVVEDEDEHDIDNGKSTSCDKRYLGRQEVEGNSGADDLSIVSVVLFLLADKRPTSAISVAIMAISASA